MATKSNVSQPANLGPDGENLPDFSKWTERQIGFSPYWKPAVGKWFFGVLTAVDARDPRFIRIQFKNLGGDMLCRRGPGNDDVNEGAIGEDVVVHHNENFSVSVYHALAREFQLYSLYRIDTGKGIPIRVDALKKTKTKSDNTVWHWRLRAEPEAAKALEAVQDKYYKQIDAAPLNPRREELET